MARVAEELVGRGAQLRALEAALATLEHGSPVAVQVFGEPGIGKTALLATHLARLVERAGQQ